jgi:two-component system, LuxR family, response regulator FixJ
MATTILIVDDEPLILKTLKLNLEEQVDVILTALNGAEALKILETQTVDCIISDVRMPVMDGLEFVRRLRMTNETVPFIFYTAHGNEQMMIEASRYGIFDFLDKPNLDGLEEVVARALKKNKTEATPVKPIHIINDLEALLADLNRSKS